LRLALPVDDVKRDENEQDGELEFFAMYIDHAEAAIQLAAAGWAGQP